jgi:RimJ/RimL family protein N-acetyltransferase
MARNLTIVSSPLVEVLVENVLIRPWEPADADAVYRACQDLDIQRWAWVPSPYLPEHATRFVTELSPGAWEAGTGAPMGVFDAATGELLGSCGLVSIREGVGEIGYWTAPWARGRGVAVAAVRAVAAFAFTSLGLRQVVWRAAVGNHASRLVALRAGVRVHGQTRVPHGEAGSRNVWFGTLLPGEVTTQTPDAYAPGSLAARQAAVFGQPPPRLPGLAETDTADLDLVTAACRDPESTRYTTLPVPYTRADAEGFMLRHGPLLWAAGEGVIYQIVDGQEKFAGTVSLRLQAGDEECAEVGFLVAPWARGRGYATGAVRSLCAWGFDALGLSRILWRAHVGNEASRRVAIKAGFAMEGVQRAGCVRHGERHDAWVGAMLATDPR